MLDLVLALHEFTDAEVADFDVAFGREQDVIKFDVSMQDPLAMYVRKALY